MTVTLELLKYTIVVTRKFPLAAHKVMIILRNFSLNFSDGVVRSAFSISTCSLQTCFCS